MGSRSVFARRNRVIQVVPYTGRRPFASVPPWPRGGMSHEIHVASSTGIRQHPCGRKLNLALLSLQLACYRVQPPKLLGLSYLPTWNCDPHLTLARSSPVFITVQKARDGITLVDRLRYEPELTFRTIRSCNKLTKINLSLHRNRPKGL